MNKLLIFITVAVTYFMSVPMQVSAQGYPSCGLITESIDPLTGEKTNTLTEDQDITFKVPMDGSWIGQPLASYRMDLEKVTVIEDLAYGHYDYLQYTFPGNTTGFRHSLNNEGTHNFSVWRTNSAGDYVKICENTYTVGKKVDVPTGWDLECKSVSITPSPPWAGSGDLKITFKVSKKANVEVKRSVTGFDQTLHAALYDPNITHTISLPNPGAGEYYVQVWQQFAATNSCSVPFTVLTAPPPPDFEATQSHKLRELCTTIPGDVLSPNTPAGRCASCFGSGGAWTAVGCIKTDPKSFIQAILRFAVGIAGGIAFLMILFGGFQIITSTGDPERLTAGRELLGAAIAGLLFIIFSLFILRLIGVSILGLPGFS